MTYIVIISGEPSGDAMVQELVPALRDLFGGGLRLGVLTSSSVEGVAADEILCRSSEPGLGVSMQAVRQWRSVLAEVVEILTEDPPDLFLAVTHHGFNLIVSAELNAIERARTRTLMLGPPEIWAWDVRGWLRGVGAVLRWMARRRQSVPFLLGLMSHRGRSTLQLFDGLACLTEPNLLAYKSLDSKLETGRLVARVGHAFARFADEDEQERIQTAGRELRSSLVSSADDVLLGLFPGSREAEVKLLLPTMLDVAERLHERYGDRLRLVVAASDERRAAQIRQLLADPARAGFASSIPLVTGQAEAVFGAVDRALLCSGTVTLLAASLGVPSVVAYDFGWSAPRRFLTHLFLRKGKLSAEGGAEEVGWALPSAVLGERVFPEPDMGDEAVENVAESLQRLIDDDGARLRMRDVQRRLLDLLRPEPPRPGYGEGTDTPMRRVACIAKELLEDQTARDHPD